MDRIRGLRAHRALITFMMGHFTVDMFGGLMPMLYPVLADRFDMNKSDIGIVALAYTGASSLSQPLFGYLADRYGSRWFAIISMMWSATMVGFAGLSQSYAMLIIFSLLAGLGSGAYHPQGASNAAAVAGDLRRNTAMSVYTVGGTVGYSLGPLLGALLFWAFGGWGTLAVAPFGFIVAFSMLKQFRRFGYGLNTHRAAEKASQSAIPWRRLAPVMAVVMLRSWVTLSVVTFIPIWFNDLHYSAAFYSVLASMVLMSSALGTLVGGILADRIGGRQVLTVSLIVATPCLLLFAMFPGVPSLAFGPAFGFSVEMGMSVTLVMAQRMLPGRVGVSSGFILGMGFVTGGIGAPVTGVLADRIGTDRAIMSMSVLIVAAAMIAWRLPKNPPPSETLLTPPVTTMPSPTAEAV